MVYSADGVSDGAGPEAVLLRRIVDAVAEYERLLIVARTRAALAVRRARHLRISHEPRYGWRLAADGRHVVADGAEQRVITLVRQYRHQGLSLRRIGARLHALGLSPRSGSQWHPQTIARMAAAAGRISAPAVPVPCVRG